MRRALLRIAAVGLLLMGFTRKTPPETNPVPGPLLTGILKHPWITAAVVAFVGTIAAFLVLLSGVVPIRASSGHWPITHWLLDLAKVRSVATHSWGLQAPPLDDQALILRGAGHYESGCSPCHGGPAAPVPPAMAAMTPSPPDLARHVGRWTAEQLFSIVKHGIKFTGMPAWPVQERDDEVWAVVAFLRLLPTLDEAGYRALVYGDGGIEDAGRSASAEEPRPPPVVRNVCRRCHGSDGLGRPGAFPSLAGQRYDYLYAALRAFATRSRHSGIMTTVVANLSDDAIREAAAYYAGLPSRSGDGAAADPAAIERGRAIAGRGFPEQDIPPCAACHGPTDKPKNPAYPRLAGQHARYLAVQLELFQARRRGGSGYANLMHAFVSRLQREHITDVTLYYGSLQDPAARSLARP